MRNRICPVIYGTCMLWYGLAIILNSNHCFELAAILAPVVPTSYLNSCFLESWLFVNLYPGVTLLSYYAAIIRCSLPTRVLKYIFSKPYGVARHGITTNRNFKKNDASLFHFLPAWGSSLLQVGTTSQSKTLHWYNALHISTHRHSTYTRNSFNSIFIEIWL